jgi:hypothetical protein
LTPASYDAIYHNNSFEKNIKDPVAVRFSTPILKHFFFFGGGGLLGEAKANQQEINGWSYYSLKQICGH